jgi:PQQ-dependent dehydrogenase (methanol/ethanol family)
VRDQRRRVSVAVPAAIAVMLSLAIGGPGCRRDAKPSANDRASTGGAPTASAAAGGVAAAAADTGEDEWVRPAKDFASTRYSTLRDLTVESVPRLAAAFTFSTGVVAGHEAAPLVVAGTMYVVTPWPNYLYALDLTRPGAPVKFTYRPKPVAAAKGVACCDVVNRGAAYADGLVIYNTLDNRTVAVDASTGVLRWETTMGDIHRGETMTMAPLVVKDVVLVGNSGGEFGVRGWIAGLDLGSGRERWRAYSTGPDAEVRIGARFTPFYASDRGADLGMASWPPDAWRTGGGAVWGWISYDPELDLIYHGTSNPGPWNAEQRPGDNKWTAGTFARDPDTGEAVWFYQWSPHDLYDHDGVNEHILLDLTIGGRVRQVLVRPERNGYVYVLDRATGEVISADPFVHITSSRGVDLATGRLLPVPEKAPSTGTVVRDICPAAPGAKDWNPASYSPDTGLVYIPHNNLCMDFEGLEANYIAGTPFVGANVRYHAGPGGHRGELSAWDPVARRKAWSVQESLPIWSATLATAGGLVFYGTMEGWFKAVDARTGALVWQFKTGSGIIGQPITYRGPDGKQYVAVLSGVGGWPGAIVVNDLDTRDATAATGWGAALQDLKAATTRGGMLYAFALP